MRAAKAIGALCVTVLSLGACTGPRVERGAERWQKFQELRPAKLAPLSPSIKSDKKAYKPGESIVLSLEAGRECSLYAFMMLPSGDVYLLLPSPRFSDSRGESLLLAPAGARREIFAPRLFGTVRLGLIVSPETRDLLSEGWLSARASREFATWPADLALDKALEFIRKSLDEKPWALAWSSFEISRAGSN